MANLKERDRCEDVRPGDPYTFLNMSKMAPDVKVGGRLSAWWNTGEPGRLFEVVNVHLKDGRPCAVETVYVGFQHAPGAFQTQDEYLKEAEKF